MGQQKNIDISMDETELKIVDGDEEAANTEVSEDEAAQDEAATADGAEQKPAKKPTPQVKKRSEKYQAVRSKVDKTREYDPFSAIELVKRLSYSEFPGTITAHLVLKDKFQGERVDFEFPHQTGKTLKVEIADDKTLKKIEAGEIDFDILLATQKMMPKLAKHAPVLGPQGLMPNPKQGTLLENPAERKKELEAGQITLRTERDAPLMHIVLGKTETETKKLVENLQALIDALGTKLQKVSLAATMSPGVRVELKAKKDEEA